MRSFMRSRRFIKSERGAALVEAAFVMPLLLLLTVGIWTTARAWNVHNTLDHAAREAARHGATEVPWVAASPTNARNVANQELQAAAINPATVTTTCIGQGNAPCGLPAVPNVQQVAVQLAWNNYKLDFVFFSMTVDLKSSAVSRWEG